MNPQARILSYLQQGKTLTVQQSIRLFRTTELRKVVSRLRRRGYRIGDRWTSDYSDDGRTVRYKEYFLAQQSL